jgi:hypothetical protein
MRRFAERWVVVFDGTRGIRAAKRSLETSSPTAFARVLSTALTRQLHPRGAAAFAPRERPRT